MGKGTTKKLVLLGVMVLLLAALVAWINVMSRQGQAAEPGKLPRSAPPKLDPNTLAARWPEIVAHAAAPARGSAGARYTIAEFGDFQCPQCGKARPLIEKMLAQYPAQVNLIFIHRPFPSIHEWALSAGQASEIAAAQGKFWPMYDTLYSHQDDLEPGFYGDYAAQAGLDRTQFKAAFEAGQGQSKVTEASKFSDSIGVQLTPTLLLRDNVAHTVTSYVGLLTKSNQANGSSAPGIDQLVAQPPWAAAAQPSTAQALPPSPR